MRAGRDKRNKRHRNEQEKAGGQMVAAGGKIGKSTERCFRMDYGTGHSTRWILVVGSHPLNFIGGETTE